MWGAICTKENPEEFIIRFECNFRRRVNSGEDDGHIESECSQNQA